MATLLDLIESAARRYGDRPAIGLRRDDGSTWQWTYRELEWRSRVAAWRLARLDLEPDARILTWSLSTPALVAVYFGAMRARLIYVPIDMGMAPSAIQRIIERSEACHLVLGTGRGAPDPAAAGLEEFPTSLVEDLTADPDGSFPPDWEQQVAAWPRPADDDVFELVFTSGTTGTPKGVMLAHDRIYQTVESIHKVVPPMRHRLTSILPLSHLYEQAVGTFYTLDVGADILQVRSRQPRILAEAIRRHRTTTMILVPQLLDLFWTGLEREIERTGRTKSFARLRGIARHFPLAVRRWLFRSVHRQFLGTDFRLVVSIGAYLPPALQLAWEDLGIIVLQGYGSTETAFGTGNRLHDRGPGTVGRTVPPFEIRIAPDGEVLFRGPTLFKGYWKDPEATAAVFDDEGWYHTGDAGRFDAAGRLVLQGRTRDMIVLPNGFNVFPEDVEKALRDAGIRESVVLQTRPGRIEAIVLAPDRPVIPGTTESDGLAAMTDPSDVAARIDAAVKAANATLGINQRIDGWRLWPGDDFPRTHTYKVKRDLVRAWVSVSGTAPEEHAGQAPPDAPEPEAVGGGRRRAHLGRRRAPRPGAGQ
ncbi:MAG TPA: AMP-binding protein [Candidatus Limnocylindrales bacterium]